MLLRARTYVATVVRGRETPGAVEGATTAGRALGPIEKSKKTGAAAAEAAGRSRRTTGGPGRRGHNKYTRRSERSRPPGVYFKTGRTALTPIYLYKS